MGEKLKNMEKKTMKDAAVEGITAMFSSLENLYFSHIVQSTAASSDQHKFILLKLLRRDPVVFLGIFNNLAQVLDFSSNFVMRYRSKLSVDELFKFDALKKNYEVDWHMKNLQKKISPISEKLKLRSVAVRNKRLAYLNKLVLEGQYFSEDVIRDREPYLHHKYIEKFQDMKDHG